MSDEFHYEEEEFEAQFNGSTVLRIMKLALKHWPLFVGFILLIMLTSIGDALGTYLLKRVIDEGVVARNMELLIKLMVYYGVILISMAGTVLGFIVCAGYLAEHIQYDLRKKLFGHLQTLSFSYYDKTPVGWIMSRVTSDTTKIADLSSWMLVDSIWAVTNIIASVYFMLKMSPRLTLIILVTLPILVYIGAVFKKYIITEFRKSRRINSKITGAYNENITGVRVVKALVREEKNLGLFQNLTGSMFKASYRAAWLSAMFMPVVQVISALALGAVLWYAGTPKLAGGMTVGTIKAFVGYITFMMWPISDIARVYAHMQNSIAGAERVFSLLDEEPQIVNRSGAVHLGHYEGDVRFEHVEFYYEEDKPVLKEFDLHVKAGETIALVGSTGGGKSTIVNLVCRFYEPKGGRILLDGEDYTSYTLESIQSRLGVVLQTPHLFSGTIRENIRYGNLNATDDQVYTAAKLAYADEFIKNFDKGYDEDVGEGGVLLSYGQKQLLSIARALISDPDIIVMDEATSAIDTITESLIQRAILNLTNRCTSFIIAHRLSTIRSAHRILVIERGRIAEGGTHAELMAARGHYFDLFSKQFWQEEETKLVGA
jgi:ATP-binding cassette, subfamily B, bacterial